MDIDRFWQLIDQARTAVGPQADQAIRDFDLRDEGDPDRDYWDFDDADMEALVDSARAEFAASSSDPDELDEELADLDEDDSDDEEEDDEDDITDPVALALYELLAQLPAAEIAGFDNTFEDVRARAGQATLANAAVLIEHGFLGDDSFDDFRAGLVALGRNTYEAAVASPDSLAGHPLVREIAAANDPRWLGREDMLFVASHAYAAVTGEDEITFYDYAEGMRDPEAASADDGDEEREWSITDEHEARRRLPHLSEMFYERSMRNRQRALDKLGLQA